MGAGVGACVGAGVGTAVDVVHAVVPAAQFPPDITYLPLTSTRGLHELSLSCLHGAAAGHVHEPAVLKCAAHAPLVTVHALVHSAIVR